jgi:uncharacterized membrane protein HdeD (DUF308 family)
MSPKLELLLLGAIGMASLVAAAFFLRFYRTTRDRFFLWFAISFGIEGINRFALGLSELPNEGATWVYLVRLFSFVLILIAIADKNRGSRAT